MTAQAAQANLQARFAKSPGALWRWLAPVFVLSPPLTLMRPLPA